jgi:TRAP transporter 4TM/12TM fusion protein
MSNSADSVQVEPEAVAELDESHRRALGPGAIILLKATTLAIFGFVAWTTLFGQLPNIRQYAIVIFMCFAMGFVVIPARAADRNKVRWYDCLAIVAVGAACLNVFVQYWPIMYDDYDTGVRDWLLGLVMVVAAAELSRRSIGISFTILIALFAAYALFGHLIPGTLGHGGATPQSLIEMLYLSTNGVWGMLTDIFASLLLLFVMLGAVMLATGVSDTFMRLARYLGGRFRGGPAKIAVISSALMGSITGSSVTNVAMTGSVTIPMMKRLGYRPEVAGGIEATASSGGQITPPLMGAGLFLMAEMLEVNVGTIMLLAVAPALLFYFSVLSAVHFDSAREGLEPLPAEDIPRAREFLPINVWGPILIPFVLLIWMISSGKSVYLSVLYTVFCMVFVYLVLSRSFSEVKEKLSRVISSLADSAESIVSLAALIVAAGVLVGVIGYLGIGIKFSNLILAVGSGYLLPTLMLAAVVVMIMGMGIPTTAAYVLAVSVVIVAFKKLGIDPMATHMFLFYFATLSAITPPVCGAVFVAANIARAPWLKVAGHTVRFASIKYLMPFLFVFHPALLGNGSAVEIATTIGSVAVGTLFMSAAFSGFFATNLSKPMRAILGAAALACLWPAQLVALSGITVCFALAALNLLATRRQSLSKV